MFVIIAYNHEQPVDNNIEFEDMNVVSSDSLIEIKEIPIKDLYSFLDDLGFSESSNRYSVRNKYGYMGKYQFGRATLRGLGYNVSSKEFMNSPELQEQAMIDLLLHNRKYLKDYIDEWDGKTKDGVLITESGILAAAHLGGQTNVRNFFRYNREFRDGNGTKLSHYLIKFGGYELGFDTLQTKDPEYIVQFRDEHVERQIMLLQ